MAVADRASAIVKKLVVLVLFILFILFMRR